MTASCEAGSATIYQFPTEAVRLAAATQRERVQLASAGALAARPRVAIGSCWYHDDAMREEAQSHQD